MANIAMKQAAQRGPTIRQQLRTMDDAEVVTSFLGGEERAFQELVERYQERAYWISTGMVGNPDDARDGAQEAFIRVFKSLDRYFADVI